MPVRSNWQRAISSSTSARQDVTDCGKGSAGNASQGQCVPGWNTHSSVGGKHLTDGAVVGAVGGPRTRVVRLELYVAVTVGKNHVAGNGTIALVRTNDCVFYPGGNQSARPISDEGVTNARGKEAARVVSNCSVVRAGCNVKRASTDSSVSSARSKSAQSVSSEPRVERTRRCVRGAMADEGVVGSSGYTATCVEADSGVPGASGEGGESVESDSSDLGGSSLSGSLVSNGHIAGACRVHLQSPASHRNVLTARGPCCSSIITHGNIVGTGCNTVASKISESSVERC